MHILNQFFEKIFVISIPRNQRRLHSFLKSFDKIDVEIIEGIDGQDLYPELEFVNQFPDFFFSNLNINPKRGKAWNKGQLGCALSNLYVQKEIVRRDLSSALILEDDASLLSSQLLYFSNALNELSPDWELFYLGYTPISPISLRRYWGTFVKFKYGLFPVEVEGKSSATKGKMFFHQNYSPSLIKPGMFFGTHAYALSNEGARKIVNLDTPLSYGFDTTLMHACYHHFINAFALKKPVIVPNARFRTTLTNSAEKETGSFFPIR